MAKGQLFLHPTSPSVTFTIFHLQTDNTHCPRHCATSYPFLSVADTPYPTMAWRRLWRSWEWMTNSRGQQEDSTGFQDSRARTNTTTLILSDLPPELIILIASMLSIQSAACLSLCNRAMSQILGPNTWRCLKLQDPEMRASFLSHLSKDASTVLCLLSLRSATCQQCSPVAPNHSKNLHSLP
jgi:hypothetical protein